MEEQKMKVNELTVGNFVYFCCFDGSKIVVHVTGFKDGIVYGDSKEDSHWCNIENVEAVRITPEILEKNGWEKRPTGYVFYIDEKRYDNSLWYIFDSNTFVVNTAEFQIKYVHELQHALRLRGIEKEIVL